MTIDDFPAKLALAMKILSLSRGRLAAELRVDKSVVARWLGGVNAPSGHNLSSLTTTIAGRRPGFTGLDWEHDLEAFTLALGVEAPTHTPATPSIETSWLPPEVLKEALMTTEARGGAYEGFWRSTRPAIDQPGRFMVDRILIRRGAHGLLTFRLTVADMVFEGVAFPSQAQLFAFCADPNTGVFIFSISNTVLRNRADVMDGLTLTLQRVGGGVPVAGAFVMERTGLLSDDPAADDARHAAMAAGDPLAPEGSVAEDVVAHLTQSVSAVAQAAGGAFLLAMPFGQSMSRGPMPGVPFPE